MAISDFKSTRDKGSPVKALMFRHGPAAADFFAYTDGLEPASLGSSGRKRVYISLDRGSSMATRGRFALAKSAVEVALLKIRAEVAAGEIYDVVLSTFGSSETRITRFDCTLADVDEIRAWNTGLATVAQTTDYTTAVAHGATWFADAGRAAKFRTWIFISSGVTLESAIAEAAELVAPLVSQAGSAAVGFIPTDVYAVAVVSSDTRNLRWMDNSPHDAIPVIETTASQVVARLVNAVQRESVVFDPAPISIGTLVSAVVPDDAGTLEIVIPKNLPLADYYRGNVPRKAMFLTIYEGQNDDPDNQFVLIWTGRVISAKRKIKGTTITLTCEPLTSSLQRTGLRRLYQYGCPHALYGDICGASREAASVRRTIGATSWDARSRVLNVGAGVLVAPTTRYVGGLISWDEPDGSTQRRSIVAVSGTTLLLNGPVDGAPGAASVIISIGCDHTRVFCEENHIEADTGLPNSVNFGGQDRIPTKNPFRFVSSYY